MQVDEPTVVSILTEIRDLLRDVRHSMPKRYKAKKKAYTPRTKKQYASLVYLTDNEHADLVRQHGEVNTKKAIEFLSAWKGDRDPDPAKDKRDYFMLSTWVMERLIKNGSYADKRNVNGVVL